MTGWGGEYVGDWEEVLDGGELVVVEEEGAKLLEGLEGEAGREGGEFIVGQVYLEQPHEGRDQVEILQRCPALAQNEHFHLLRLFNGLKLVPRSLGARHHSYNVSIITNIPKTPLPPS